MNLPATGEQLKPSWDSIWENVFQLNEWGKYPDESFIRFVARNFYKSDRKKTKILEVGCGPGANIWYMAREGFDTYGIDGSPTAIQRAKNRLEKESLKAHLKVGDIVSLPYPDEFFDAVADNECLAHNSIIHMDKILVEIKRVLKKEGLFYSRTFTDQVYLGRTQRKLKDWEYNQVSDGPFAGRGLVRLTTQDGIQSLYGQSLKILSIDKIEYTNNNGAVKISEWVIICQK